MKLGYARVSTTDQTLNLQTDALNAAGCARIFSDTGISGAKRERPGLADCFATLQPGDCLVVYKLDRLGRSLAHVIEIIDGFAARKIHFQSITEGFDTTTPSGKMIFHIIGALAEFERALIRERVTAGVRAAQARGVHCGRANTLTPEQRDLIRILHQQGKNAPELSEQFGISLSTAYRTLRTK